MLCLRGGMFFATCNGPGFVRRSSVVLGVGSAGKLGREAMTMRDIKRDTGAIMIPHAEGDWALDPSEAGDDE